MPEITVEAPLAPWPFSTPRESGFSSGFGTRGGSFGGFTGLGNGAGVGGGGLAGPRNQLVQESAPSCSGELISLVGAAGLDLLSLAALGGGGLLIAKGSSLLIRGSLAEFHTIALRSGAVTIGGVLRQSTTYGLSNAAKAAAAQVQIGQSLIGLGSGLIAGDISTNVSTGTSRPFSLLDLLPGPGTYSALKGFLACRQQQ